MIDSSAKELHSEWGSVTIRQTDSSKRIISDITACNKIVAENSSVNNVTFYVNHIQRALLDLTNTKVSEKILIKINESLFSKITHVFSSFVGISNHNFSLMIKGTTEMPENIDFEGFDKDEITSEMTNDGILVTGKKNNALLSEKKNINSSSFPTFWTSNERLATNESNRNEIICNAS